MHLPPPPPTHTHTTVIITGENDESFCNTHIHILQTINAQVFVETKKGCDQLTRSLRGESFPIAAIHGDKSQQERDQVTAFCNRFPPPN